MQLEVQLLVGGPFAVLLGAGEQGEGRGAGPGHQAVTPIWDSTRPQDTGPWVLGVLEVALGSCRPHAPWQ